MNKDLDGNLVSKRSLFNKAAVCNICIGLMHHKPNYQGSNVDSKGVDS